MDKRMILIGIMVIMGIIGLFSMIFIAHEYIFINEDNETSSGYGYGSGGGSVISGNNGNIIIPLIPDEDNLIDLKNGSYRVKGLIKSYADNDYIKVKILVTGYDINGTKIVDKKLVINKIKANSDSEYDVILTPTDGKIISSAYADVINATEA